MQIDFVRDNSLSKITIFSLPVFRTEREVTLKNTQAIALLKEGKKLLRNFGSNHRDAAQLRSEQRGYPLPGATTTPSEIWILEPNDGIRRMLLETARFQSREQVQMINDEAAPTLEALPSTIDAGLAALKDQTDHTLQMQLKRGLFETVQLTLKVSQEP